MKTLNVILASPDDDKLDYAHYLSHDYRYFPYNFLSEVEKLTSVPMSSLLPMIMVDEAKRDIYYPDENPGPFYNMTHLSEKGHVFSLRSSKNMEYTCDLLKYHMSCDLYEKDELTVLDLTGRMFDKTYSDYKNHSHGCKLNEIILCHDLPLAQRDTEPNFRK